MSRIVVALGGNALGNSPYEQMELVKATAKNGILAVAFTNGIPEMILSVIITISVITAVNKIRHN